MFGLGGKKRKKRGKVKKKGRKDKGLVLKHKRTRVTPESVKKAKPVKPAKAQVKKEKKAEKGGFFHFLKPKPHPKNEKKAKKEKKPKKQAKNPPKPKAKPIVYRKPTTGITTEVDDMLQFVSDKKKVKIDILAKRMKVTEKQVQEWVGILEERGLVSMHYPPIGKPEVRIGVEKTGEES